MRAHRRRSQDARMPAAASNPIGGSESVSLELAAALQGGK
jgi:hypothetical protein